MKLRRIVLIAGSSVAVGMAVIAVLCVVFSKDVSDYFVKLADDQPFDNKAQAINYDSWAIFFNHKNSLAYFDRGLAKIYDNNADIDSAIADFDQAIAISPDSAVIIEERAKAKLSKHDNDGALHDLDEAIKLGASFEAHYERGNLRFMKNDLEGAVADYTSAIESYPKYREAYDSRAYLEYLLGNRAIALSDCRKMTEFEPDQQDNWRLMIWLIESDDVGQQAIANKELNDYIHTKYGQSNSWPAPLARFLTGGYSQNDLLKDLSGNTDVKYHVHVCYFFIGVKNALDGDVAAAETYLQKSKNANEGSGPFNRLPDMWLKRLESQKQ